MTSTEPVPPPQGPTYTIAGETVTVPVEVRSARMVGGTFTVPATAAQELIDHSGLRIQRFAGALGLCMLSAIQYADNDLGPYHEVALAFAVHPHDGSTAGSPATGNVTTFIHRLPVNQEFTCQAGRDIWGFPKWVAGITYRPYRGRTDVVLMDGGDLVLALGISGRSVPAPANDMEMSCYSWREGVLRRTPWTMRMSRVRMRPGGAQVELGAEHEMARELRDLGFPKGALVSQSVGHLECSFGAAEEITPG